MQPNAVWLLYTALEPQTWYCWTVHTIVLQNARFLFSFQSAIFFLFFFFFPILPFRFWIVISASPVSYYSSRVGFVSIGTSRLRRVIFTRNTAVCVCGTLWHDLNIRPTPPFTAPPTCRSSLFPASSSSSHPSPTPSSFLPPFLPSLFSCLSAFFHTPCITQFSIGFI